MLRDVGRPDVGGPEDGEILRGLLEAVALDGPRSQRGLASDLGIALGLVNAYLKRCIKKGLVKVGEAPPRRYAYYLTPQGFAEKSRLTVEYLTSSFSFFRQARADCTQTFALAKERNFPNLALVGKSDLAEIQILSAVDCDVSIVAIIDRAADTNQFVGRPLVSSYNEL